MGLPDNLESWHDGAMARDHDFFVNARRVVEQAIGEHMDGTPLENKGSRASAGSKGGKKGGKARAEKLSPQARKTIAQKAAKARWAKNQ
jgi:hypothetical protein